MCFSPNQTNPIVFSPANCYSKVSNYIAAVVVVLLVKLSKGFFPEPWQSQYEHEQSPTTIRLVLDQRCCRHGSRGLTRFSGFVIIESLVHPRPLRASNFTTGCIWLEWSIAFYWGCCRRYQSIRKTLLYYPYLVYS